MKKLILSLFILFPICSFSQSIISYEYDNNFESEGIAKIDDKYYVGAQIAANFVIYQFDENMELQWTDTLDSFTRPDSVVHDEWMYIAVEFEKHKEGIRAFIIGGPGIFITVSYFSIDVLYSKSGERIRDSVCFCIENNYRGTPPKLIKRDYQDFYIAWYHKLRWENTEHNTVARVGEYGVRNWVEILDTLAKPKMHKIDDLTVDADGDLWITGKMNYDGGGDKPPYLSHVSSDGVELGRYGTNSEKRFKGMRVVMINNEPVVFATWREENESYKHGFEYRVIAYKLENGQLIETGLVFDNPDKEIDFIETTLSTSDGGAIVSIPSLNLEEVNPKFLFSTKDIMFVKLDSNLNVVWKQNFGAENEIETSYQAFEESPGRYTFSGKIGDRFSLIKIDETETSVESQLPIKETEFIDLFDMNGRLILENIKKESIDKNQLKSGVYFLQSETTTEKLIIAR